MELTVRQIEILKNIFREYIRSGEPVGSRTISRLGMNLSPATIRNEMSDLTEMGYLFQPHTSAGRVPSARAISLMLAALTGEGQQLTARELENIKAALAQLRNYNRYLTGALKQISRVIARFSNYPGVALLLSPEARQFSRVDFIRISADEIAALFVAEESGMVETLKFTLEVPISDQQLKQVGEKLTALGRPFGLADVEATVEKIVGFNDNLKSFVYRIVQECFTLMVSRRNYMVIEGIDSIIDLPSLSDSDKLTLLKYFTREKENLMELVTRLIENQQPSLIMSEQFRLPVTGDIFAVGRGLDLANHFRVGLGVVGPRSMEYPRIIAVINECADALSRTSF